MKIVLTGGGSGGHITPLLAVAHELKQLNPEVTLIYIGQRGDSLADVPAQDPNIAESYSVRAGKFRRYHGEGLKQVLDVQTVFKNIRDAGRVVIGLNQSWRLLKRLRPDLVFVKGGFVGVPVGLAAAKLHIPFVTHDSDAVPGLANRIIARWAAAHAVALPKELYRQYPADKTFTVGVPISSEFTATTNALQQRYKKELGLERFEQIVFVTGGGNGAKILNKAVVASATELLAQNPTTALVHLSGRALEVETRAAYAAVLPPEEQSRVIVKGFVTDLYRYSGAADVIIARGSATNLAEFAAQAKPCIIVPATQLIWTVRNTEALAHKGAVVAIEEAELSKHPDHLSVLASELLSSPAKQAELSRKLASFAHPDAARELAKLLLTTLLDAASPDKQPNT